MALIVCKECGKEMSDQLKKCPNCGYKEKNIRKQKILKKVFIITFVVILIALTIITVIARQESSIVEKQINQIGKVTLESNSKIEKAEKNLEKLNVIQKILVMNKNKLTNARKEYDLLPQNLTKENILDFLSFNVDFNNFKDTSFTLQGMKFGGGTANIIITTASLKDLKYENVKVKMKCKIGTSLFPWNDAIIEFKIANNGVTTNTSQIKFSSIVSPTFPSLNGEIEFLEVTGIAKK